MILAIFGFIVIAWVDLLPLIRAKDWKEAAGTGGVLLAALVMTMLVLSGVEIPSPLHMLGGMLQKLGIGYS